MPVLSSDIEVEGLIKAEYYYENGDEFNSPEISGIKLLIDYESQDEQTKKLIQGLLFEDIEERKEEARYEVL